MDFEDMIKWIICIWVAYPFASIGSYFRPAFPSFEWGLCAVVCAVATVAVIIVYVVLKIKEIQRKKFDIEIYESEGSVPYEQFLYWYVEKQSACELEYKEFFIHLSINKDNYSYQVFRNGELIKEESFKTQKELLETKIMAGQTIKEIWQYVCFRTVDGIIYSENKQ